jgi:hypothetical protein
MKTKSVQLNSKLHSEVKEYCNENGLKLQQFVETLIENGLSKNIQSNSRKSKKRMQEKE